MRPPYFGKVVYSAALRGTQQCYEEVKGGG